MKFDDNHKEHIKLYQEKEDLFLTQEEKNNRDKHREEYNKHYNMLEEYNKYYDMAHKEKKYILEVFKETVLENNENETCFNLIEKKEISKEVYDFIRNLEKLEEIEELKDNNNQQEFLKLISEQLNTQLNNNKALLINIDKNNNMSIFSTEKKIESKLLERSYKITYK